MIMVMIFMVGWDLLWVFGSPSIVSRAAAFLGFFSFLWFSFFFLLFSLSLSNIPTWTVAQLVQLSHQTPSSQAPK